MSEDAHATGAKVSRRASRTRSAPLPSEVHVTDRRTGAADGIAQCRLRQRGPAFGAETKQPMQLIRDRTAIPGTQGDPWKPFQRPSTGRLPGRSACRIRGAAQAVTRYAFLQRAVTLWAALWAETVFAGCSAL